MTASVVLIIKLSLVNIHQRRCKLTFCQVGSWSTAITMSLCPCFRMHISKTTTAPNLVNTVYFRFSGCRHVCPQSARLFANSPHAEPGQGRSTTTTIALFNVRGSDQKRPLIFISIMSQTIDARGLRPVSTMLNLSSPLYCNDVASSLVWYFNVCGRGRR